MTVTTRVGLIIPSSNRMVEQEMVPAFAPSVQAHVKRLRMTGANHCALDRLLPRIEELLRLSETEFREIFRSSPVKRAKWRGLLRNACVAAGNWAASTSKSSAT